MKDFTSKDFEQLQKEFGQLLNTFEMTKEMFPNAKNERALELAKSIQKNLHLIKPSEGK
jgi:hypothetical protein